VNEDAGPQALADWATGIAPGPPDEAAQTVWFEVTSDNPGLFAAPPTLSAAGLLQYQPQANANGSATVTVVLHDDGGGADTSAPQTFTITVSPVNDAPSFLKGASLALAEDAAAQTLPGWATGISPGPPDEAGQSVWFEATVSVDDARLFAVPPAVAPDGTLSFTPRGNTNGTATVTLVLHDDGGTALGGDDASAPQVFTIELQPLLRYVGSIPGGGTSRVDVYDADRTADVTLGDVLVRPGSGNSIRSIALAGAGGVGGLSLVISGASAVGAITEARLGPLAGLGFVASTAPVKSVSLQSAMVGYDLNGLTLNGVGFAADLDGDGDTHDLAGLSVAGLVSKLTFAQWQAGGIAAGGLGSLTATGDFGADLTLTGAGLPAGKGPLPKAAIAGRVTGGAWRVAGDAGKLAIGSAAAAWSAQFTGNLAALASAGTLSGTLAARSVRKLSAGGNIEDFALTLTQPPDPKLPALGSLAAAWLDGSRILATGGIGKVALLGMRDSSVFAGVAATRDANGDGVLDLPAAAADLAAAGASIASLRLRGILVGGVPADSFINSSVAAGLLGSVALPRVQNANAWPFGLAAHQILALSYEGAPLKLPTPFQDGAFELRVG